MPAYRVMETQLGEKVDRLVELMGRIEERLKYLVEQHDDLKQQLIAHASSQADFPMRFAMLEAELARVRTLVTAAAAAKDKSWQVMVRTILQVVAGVVTALLIWKLGLVK